LISWTDITPTILDYGGVDHPVYSRHIGQAVMRDHFPENHGLHGRSFRPILEETDPEGWDRVYASHTFHEIHMYYPMRVVRDRDYKLIWNKAYGTPYPFASDLQTSSTWQYILAEGPDAQFGVRTADEYINRPEFELFDMQNDPYESRNLAENPDYSEILKTYIEQLREFQRRTLDPWYIHWVYEDDTPAFYEDVEEY
jgi:N-sulfoglucosamine sulfohydrolase